MSKKIYVGNLSFSTTEAELRGLFEEHGTVGSVNVIVDRDTGRSKGFAFIEMDDRDIRVREARERGSGGGGGGGYRGGRDRY